MPNGFKNLSHFRSFATKLTKIFEMSNEIRDNLNLEQICGITFSNLPFGYIEWYEIGVDSVEGDGNINYCLRRVWLIRCRVRRIMA